MPAAGNLPSVVDTTHYLRTRQRLNLAQAGPWQLDGYDTVLAEDVTTRYEG
jgi:hypothetical protein